MKAAARLPHSKMRLVSSWIREFVDIAADDRQLAADLTMAGLAVDSIETADNGEVCFEADITTNRPDAMNHYGVAREASVIYDRELKPFRAQLRESAGHATDRAAVEIADPGLCARYSARVITGVKIGRSPEWMVRRLEAAGVRSINNVADVTNYVLLELGHPTHAFDLDTLAGHKIIVRRARPGERLITLDGVTREFTPDDVMIADAERAVAIGGVMGGEETSIHSKTTNVLLESAWFEPRTIRRTARRQGMHTDASHRFERGADLSATTLAADRGAELIQRVAGGEILRGVIDTFPAPRPARQIPLRASEIARILGAQVAAEELERILRRLGFALTAKRPGESWTITAPSFRSDVEREIDLIEEIARHFGYDRFADRLPAWSGTARRAPHWRTESVLRETARALGYSEAMTFSLVPPRENQEFAILDAGRQPVTIANPLSEEASQMRASAVPGALNAAEWNLNRGARSVRLFEVGNVYVREGSGYQEPAVLVLAASGAADESPLHAPNPQREVGFFDIKGDVERLLELFEHRKLCFDSATGVDYYHPGRAARAAMDGETVARFGELHPRISGARKLRQPVLVAELFLDRLYRRGLRRPVFEPLPRVPAVDRDLSLLVPADVVFERVAEVARGIGIETLLDLQPVEIFRGGQLPEGHVPQGMYSLLLRLVFQHAVRTLSDEEVNLWSGAISAALREKLGIIQRI